MAVQSQETQGEPIGQVGSALYFPPKIQTCQISSKRYCVMKMSIEYSTEYSVRYPRNRFPLLNALAGIICLSMAIHALMIWDAETSPFFWLASAVIVNTLASLVNAKFMLTVVSRNNKAKRKAERELEGKTCQTT